MSKANPQRTRRSQRRRVSAVAAAGSFVLALESPLHCSGEAARSVLENCKSILLDQLGSRPDTIAYLFLGDLKAGDEAIQTLLAQVETIRAELETSGDYLGQSQAGGFHYWLQRLPAQWYERSMVKEDVFQSAYRALNTLVDLRSYSLGQGEDWDRLMTLLRNVVRAMAGDDESALPGEADSALIASRLAALRKEIEAAEQSRQTAVVFGTQPPSAEGLANYLKSLRRQETFTLAERKAVVATVNFWKRRLKLQLRYAGQPCKLSYVTNELEGQFVLRTPGTAGSYLFSKTAFPPLKLAPAKQPRTSRGD